MANRQANAGQTYVNETSKRQANGGANAPSFGVVFINETGTSKKSSTLPMMGVG